MADLLQHHRHHDPNIGLIPVPHGPETGDEVDEYPRIGRYTAEQERLIFSHLTHPDDSFNDEGTYWADLPFWKRLSFVNKVNNEEAKRELKATGRLAKRDPLGPVGWYFRNAVLPGAGLGLEGYVLFSIGNLEPLFASTWKQCWGKNPDVCDSNWIAAVTYLEIVGIMAGQVAVGVSDASAQFFAAGFNWLMISPTIRSLVTGSVDDGVSSKMPPSCLSASSC